MILQGASDLIYVVPIAITLLGCWLVLRPGEVIRLNRDDSERDAVPIGPGELWRARVLGVLMIAAGIFFLRALLTGQPGAEFFPV